MTMLHCQLRGVDGPSLPDPRRFRIAYFTMEIGLAAEIPTYSGGLGVLAGDHARASADLGLPMVVVSLVHRDGYFRQHLGADGRQTEQVQSWDPASAMLPASTEVRVALDGRDVRVGAWLGAVIGADGASIPVVLLDTDREGNDAADRALTDRLYGGEAAYRLRQESILGIGGVRMLRALGYHELHRYHLNEGHAALLIMELLREEAHARSRPVTDDGVREAVAGRCVFTTHTPVAAGHDQFEVPLVGEVLGRELGNDFDALISPGREAEPDRLNLTRLALNLSHFVNGVAERHGAVSRAMFPGYEITAITNGVHTPTWVAPPMARLFDARLPNWRTDPFDLRHVLAVDLAEIREAHDEAKSALIDLANDAARSQRRTLLDRDALTIGFARRATAYKRAGLVLEDPQRLMEIARAHGGLQIIFSGKAHPRDEAGKSLMAGIIASLDALSPLVRGIWLPGYDMALALHLVSGVDLWLNTPQPPLEASGTSGMKAAINGVPSLSVLDGWWLEGCIEGVTGWGIGDPTLTRADERMIESEATRRADATSLLDKLEHVILPLYHADRDRWTEVMRAAIAINGPHFSAHRMVMQYAMKAYL